MGKGFKIEKDLKEVNDNLNEWVKVGIGRQFLLVAVDSNNDILTNMKHFGYGSLAKFLIHIVMNCPHLVFDVYVAAKTIVDCLNNDNPDFEKALEKCKDYKDQQDLFVSNFEEYIEKLKADE